MTSVAYFHSAPPDLKVISQITERMWICKLCTDAEKPEQKTHILFPEVVQKRHFTTAAVFFAASSLRPRLKTESLGLRRLCSEACGRVRVGGCEVLRLLGVKGDTVSAIDLKKYSA